MNFRFSRFSWDKSRENWIGNGYLNFWHAYMKLGNGYLKDR